MYKVIASVPAIFPEASGGNIVVRRIIKELTSLGLENHLFTIDDECLFSGNESLGHHVVSRCGIGPKKLGRSPAMYNALFNCALTCDINLVHNHSLWMMPNVYPGWVAQKLSLPYFVSPHGTLSEYAFSSGSIVKKVFWPLVQRPSLDAVTHFHATAYSEYEDIRRMGFKQPIAVIPNGVDIPLLTKKLSSNKRTLLFLSRIHKKKGLDLLLRAWSTVHVKYPEWILRIVGPDNGGYITELEALSAELRLQRIEFSGPLYGDEKWTAYRDADLFVLPTRSENFGVAVAEALAAGTPAIVTKGAPWEGLEEKNAGWWIDIGVDPLVACLTDAMSREPDVLEAMGMRGRLWMEQDYSWATIGQHMLQTYRWAIDGGERPAWVIEH